MGVAAVPEESRTADVSGYQHSDVGLIPGEWEVAPLSELFEFRNGVNADKTAYGRGVRFINVLEAITHSHLTADQIPGRVRLTPAARDAYLVRPGDVVFNRTSETQDEVGFAAVYLGNEPVVFGGFVIRGRPLGSRLDSEFAGFILRAQAVREQIVKRGQGAIRANIGQADLRQVLVPLPPLPEQHAITRALQDADGRVGTLRRLIQKKRAIRQATLHELLTPKTRLQGHADAWHTRPIAQLGRLVMGQSPPSTHYNMTGDGVPLLQGNLDIRDGRAIARVWTTRVTKACEEGDVLLTVRAPVGSVGLATEPACLGRGVCAIKIDPAVVDRDFLFFALVHAEPRWKALEQGSTFTAANSEQVAAFELAIPDSLSEQQEIAHVLADIDRELESLLRQAEKAHAVRIGAAQELLSGRLRLPEKSDE
jgi:type I restriction enzyme S subunit